MATPLGDDEINEIIEMYQELGGPEDATYKETAEALPYAEKTVRKYLREWEEETFGDDPADEEDEWSAEPYEGVDEHGGGEDFASMSPGDFIEWFFGQDGLGVKQSFVNVLAQKCNVRGKIPDHAEMVNELINGNSRISNAHEAGGIAEVYWDAAQNWLAAQGQLNGQQGTVAYGGQWQGPDQNGGQQGQGTNAGSWIPAGGGQGNPQGQGQGQPPNGQGNPQHQGPPPQQGYQGQPQYPQQPDPAVQELKESINELARSQKMILRQMNDPQAKNQEVKSMQERVQEMAEIQRTLQEMHGDDGPDPEIKELRAQLQAMQQQFAEAAQESESINVEGDGGIAALARLAANGDLDPDTLGILADSMGITDPEVKKAEMDFRKTQAKLQNREELVEKVFDGIGEASGDLFATAFQAFSNGSGDEEGGQEGDEEGADTVAPAEGGMRDGQLQVVGEGDTNGQSGSDMSPTGQRYADDFQEFQETRYRGPTDQGGGGGGQPLAEGGCQHRDENGEVCGDPIEEGQVFCDDHRIEG